CGSPYSLRNLALNFSRSRSLLSTIQSFPSRSHWQLPRAALHLIAKTSPGTLNRSPKMLRTISLSISFAFLFALALPSAAQTTFTETSFTTDIGTSWATTGDFDRDALPDIAVAEENSNSVAISKIAATTLTPALIPRQS